MLRIYLKKLIRFCTKICRSIRDYHIFRRKLETFTFAEKSPIRLRKISKRDRIGSRGFQKRTSQQLKIFKKSITQSGELILPENAQQGC